MLNGYLFYERFPQTHAFYDDFFNHGRYFFVFAFGYLMVNAPQHWQWIARVKTLSLLAAMLSYAGVLYLFNGHSLGGGQVANFIWSANSWLWILAVCGWAQHLLNFNHPLLHYLNGGVYCFYILHQTLIIVLADWLADFQLGPAVEPVALIVLTVLSCWLGFAGIKHLTFLRLAFGINGKSQSKLLNLQQSRSAEAVQQIVPVEFMQY